jgi:hypothetical protein
MGGVVVIIVGGGGVVCELTGGLGNVVEKPGNTIGWVPPPAPDVPAMTFPNATAGPTRGPLGTALGGGKAGGGGSPKVGGGMIGEKAGNTTPEPGGVTVFLKVNPLNIVLLPPGVVTVTFTVA